jgi:hypothetical protein
VNFSTYLCVVFKGVVSRNIVLTGLSHPRYVNTLDGSPWNTHRGWPIFAAVLPRFAKVSGAHLRAEFSKKVKKSAPAVLHRVRGAASF